MCFVTFYLFILIIIEYFLFLFLNSKLLHINTIKSLISNEKTNKKIMRK